MNVHNYNVRLHSSKKAVIVSTSASLYIDIDISMYMYTDL